MPLKSFLVVALPEGPHPRIVPPYEHSSCDRHIVRCNIKLVADTCPHCQPWMFPGHERTSQMQSPPLSQRKCCVTSGDWTRRRHLKERGEGGKGDVASSPRGPSRPVESITFSLKKASLAFPKPDRQGEMEVEEKNEVGSDGMGERKKCNLPGGRRELGRDPIFEMPLNGRSPTVSSGRGVSQASALFSDQTRNWSAAVAAAAAAVGDRPPRFLHVSTTLLSTCETPARGVSLSPSSALRAPRRSPHSLACFLKRRLSIYGVGEFRGRTSLHPESDLGTRTCARFLGLTHSSCRSHLLRWRVSAKATALLQTVAPVGFSADPMSSSAARILHGFDRVCFRLSPSENVVVFHLTRHINARPKRLPKSCLRLFAGQRCILLHFPSARVLSKSV